MLWIVATKVEMEETEATTCSRLSAERSERAPTSFMRETTSGTAAPASPLCRVIRSAASAPAEADRAAVWAEELTSSMPALASSRAEALRSARVPT